VTWRDDIGLYIGHWVTWRDATGPYSGYWVTWRECTGGVPAGSWTASVVYIYNKVRRGDTRQHVSIPFEIIHVSMEILYRYKNNVTACTLYEHQGIIQYERLTV